MSWRGGGADGWGEVGKKRESVVEPTAVNVSLHQQTWRLASRTLTDNNERTNHRRNPWRDCYDSTFENASAGGDETVMEKPNFRLGMRVFNLIR